MPFVGVVFALAAVFYVAGPLLGNLSRLTRAELPASALMFVCPTAAAVLLIRRADGWLGVRRWLAAAVRWPTTVRVGWLATATLLLPLIMVLSYLVLSWSGTPLPRPHLPWASIPGLAVVYLVGALGEELGWTGYATGPLRRRYGVMGAALVVGVVWAAWHVVPYLQAGHGPAWIGWQTLFTIGFRTVLVWLYEGTGSVLVVVVCHASYNVAWSVFPDAGSHYDPMVTALLTSGVAIVLSVVGARMLRYGADRWQRSC